MYQGRSYTERKTNKNNAWTKQELLEICIQKGIVCKKNLTKSEICNLIIEHEKKEKKDSESVSLCNFKRDIIFKILMDVSF